jgi:hypothetical protein
MSKYESELRHRLASGEPIEAVERWYLNRVNADKFDWEDASAFEVQFMQEIERKFCEGLGDADEHFARKILELIVAGNVEIQDLAAATGASIEQVEEMVERLQAAGFLQRRTKH